MWPERDFDILRQLETFAATACGILVVLVVIGVLVVLGRCLRRIGRERWLNKQ